MSRAYPFRRPPADVVATGPWLRLGPAGPDELGQSLPDWDYDAVLRLRRQLRVDGLRIRTSSGLAPDADVDVAVVWASTSSALRDRVWRAPLPAEDAIELLTEFDLRGGELGGRLDLTTVITLRSPGSVTSSAAAPRRPGSVLWRDVHPVLLQGDTVLFPLSVVDFADLPYPTGAAWHLELSRSLDAQAMGSILLLANARREAVISALASAAEPSDADRRVLSTIRTDVIRSLVERAVTDDHFEPDEEYETGSIGALLGAVLRATFPDRTIDALRRERQHDPILFTTRIQSATELLAGT